MTDYKELYYTLFDPVTGAVGLLQNAQAESEAALNLDSSESESSSEAESEQ